jgi:hypothetical protein
MTINRSCITFFILFAVMLALVACSGNAPTSSGSTPTGLSSTPPDSGNGERSGGEGGLVTYTDAAQHFSIELSGSWTQDTSVSNGVKFVGGEDSLVLEFRSLPASSDLLSYVQQDATTLGATFPGFQQVTLAPSTEVQKAVVLGFESDSTSAVTGKTYRARSDRFYIQLVDRRLAVLTVSGPTNHYDREGVRDIALTLKVTR